MVYSLHSVDVCAWFCARVWKRDAKPCRNCAIKRSEVSAHIFNTLIYCSKIIKSHLKRSIFLLFVVIYICILWLTSSFLRYKWTYNIFVLFLFRFYISFVCVHVIVSLPFILTLWYSIKTKYCCIQYNPKQYWNSNHSLSSRLSLEVWSNQ